MIKCGDVSAGRRKMEPFLAEVKPRETDLWTPLNGLPHLIWTCLPTGACDFLSSQWAEYTGISFEEQLGDEWFAQLHPEDRESVKAKWFAGVREDTAFYLDCRIRRFDGVYRWFRTLATPIRDSNGVITKWCGSHTDIEDCKRSEESYRMNEERLRLAQQVASIGTFEWDVRTGSNVWTPELEAMYGLEPGSFGKTQESWEQLIHPEDRNAAIARVQLAFDTSAPVEGEWRVLWPDGSVHWIVGRFQVIRDEDHKPTRLIGVNVDITSRKKSEDEIRRLNEHLERLVRERTEQLGIANCELEEFSYSVAHELRAPLRGMHGFAKILLEDHKGELSEEGIRCVHRVQKNALIMGELIDALLLLARVSRCDLKLERINFSALARSIGRELAASTPERSLSVVVQEHVEASVDAGLARTLLEHLIGNAWKFTSKVMPSKIEFGVTHNEGVRAFFVRDNGVGFNMDHASKLFVPFQKLHAAREFSGIGVGLAAAHRIVTRHGGRMWAEGKLGEGATFFFTLPQATPLELER